MKTARVSSRRHFCSLEEVEREYLPHQHEQRTQQSSQDGERGSGTGLVRQMLQRLRRQLHQQTAR